MSCRRYVHSRSHIEKKKILRTKNRGSADRQIFFSWYLDVHLAVSGKAYPLPSHVMGGGDRQRERERGREGGRESREKKVFTYLI